MKILGFILLGAIVIPFMPLLALYVLGKAIVLIAYEGI